MDTLQTNLGPEALGWTAALLTLLTFFSADMRRLRLLALAANAAFIAYGTAAQLLPVLVLHLALVPVNLWRLNQTFQRKPGAHPAKPTLAQRAARQPGGWTPARRASRASRRQPGSAVPSQQSEVDTGTGTRSCATAAADQGALCQARFAVIPGRPPAPRGCSCETASTRIDRL